MDFIRKMLGLGSKSKVPFDPSFDAENITYEKAFDMLIKVLETHKETHKHSVVRKSYYDNLIDILYPLKLIENDEIPEFYNNLSDLWEIYSVRTNIEILYNISYNYDYENDLTKWVLKELQCVTLKKILGILNQKITVLSPVKCDEDSIDYGF